ncbi:helix-turn-helix transcriptional regulator [Acrocarpospora phusangensis]|nr:LuxR family transcriptional regulator [Acrocarpospora phusangensis]
MAVGLCPVLVGRDREREDLQAALRAARTGTAGTHLISGVAGVGKSRLVASLLADAAADGMATLRGRAVQTGRREAFRPITEALMSALRSVGSAELDGLRPYRPAIGWLVPEWAEGTSPPDVSLVVLAEGVTRLLAAVARERGALVVFEDVHWADPETLGVLEYLADNLRSERVLCVATLRPDPGSEAYGLARRLAARGSATQVRLSPLPASDVRRMARLCLGVGESDDLPPALEPLVLARAEGLPLLVEDLLSTSSESGVLLREGGVWRLAERASRVIPSDFADTVRRRLELLGDPARGLLEAAAALGAGFDWRIAAEVAGQPAATAVAELRRAAGVHLLWVDEGEDGPSFRFHHSLTRDAVWSTLLASDRARISAGAYDAVLARYPDLPGEWCELAASLSERAGRPQQAASLLLRSGRRALARGALSTAEQVLERAGVLADGCGDHATGTLTGEALTEVLALAGKTDQAFRVGEGVLARLDEMPDSTARRIAVRLCLARTAIGAMRWEEAGDQLDLARTLGRSGPGTAFAARIDVMAARLALEEGRLDDATALGRTALAHAAGAPEVACEALIILGRRERLHDMAAAARSFAEAYGLAEGRALPYWSIQALHELGTVETLTTGSLDRFRQARDLAVASGALATAAILEVQLAGAHQVRFEPELGLAAATRAIEGARRFRLRGAQAMATVYAAGCYALEGRSTEMAAALAEAEALAGDDGAAVAMGLGHGRSLFHLLREERAAALDALEEAMVRIRRVPTGPPGIFRGLWALVRTLDDDPEQAEQARAEVRESGAVAVPINVGILGFADAAALGRGGDRAAAERVYATADSALASWEGGDGLRQLARRLVAEAALRDGWGDPAVWLREAAAFFSGTPHHAVVVACQSLLRSAGLSAPRLAVGDVPADLRARGVTERERDVLALVGLRLSNKEIADRLVLSPRTVEKHVEHLLAKTGLDNRLALAGLAVRLRLTETPPPA